MKLHHVLGRYRELLGWHLSRSGKAATAASALENALVSRFGTLGKVPHLRCSADL